MGNLGSGSNWIQIRKQPDPDLDIAGSRSGEIRIWIRFRRQYPDLDPFWPDLDPGSGSKDMVMDPFRLYSRQWIPDSSILPTALYRPTPALRQGKVATGFCKLILSVVMSPSSPAKLCKCVAE